MKLDTSPYKCPTPGKIRAGRVCLTARPLAPTEIQQARQTARTVFAGRGAEPEGAMFAVERIVHVLSVATGATPTDLKYMTPMDLIHLYDQWEVVQGEATPDYSVLDSWVRLQMASEDPEVHNEGAVCYQAKTPSEYYGRPTSLLTSGQVAYWLAYRSAYHEYCVVDGGKQATRSALRRKLTVALEGADASQDR